MEESEPSSGSGGRSSPLPTISAVVLGLGVLAAGMWFSRSEELLVVLVSMDTTRADHLTPYGYDRDTSPTLDRLAREGTVFTQARSSTSWTLPSHMSLFTGLPAAVHDVVIDFQRLDSGRRTMGQVFHDAGFHTVGLFTAPYVHPRFGFGAGMDFYESMTANPMAYDLTPAQMNREMGLREAFSHQEVTSPRVADRARWFLTNRSAPRNFLFLHLFDPHYDYKAPPKIVQRFADPAYAGPIQPDGIMGQLDLIHEGMAPTDLAHLVDLYDAEINFTDRSLASVIATIEAEGLVGRTIVVVVADHGEEFLEHGRFGHRMGLGEEVLRVPLIVWGPGIIPEGRTIDDEVALYDVLPTLMDYADIPSEPLIYGRSLRPLIDGESLPARPSSASLTFLHRDGPDYYTKHDALVFQGIKVMRRVRVPWSRENDRNIFNPPDWSTAEYEVYDLRQDPHERDDLYARSPDDPRVKAIRKALEDEEAAQLEAADLFTPRGLTPLSHDPFENVDVFAQMKELGYLR